MSTVSLNPAGRPRSGAATRANGGEMRHAGRIDRTQSASFGDIDGILEGESTADAAALALRAATLSQSPMEPITKHLGLLLTAANPAWSGDPLPRMRGLQKKLIEYGLTLDQASRGSCLQAIAVVEEAVRMRQRLQQLRIEESNMQPEEAQQR